MKGTEEKLRDLQRSASLEMQEGAPILSREQAETLKVFREQIINIRKRLRDVQRDLRLEIEQLGLILKIYNIWFMPMLVAIVSIVVFILRRRKRVTHLASIQNKR